MHLAGTYMAYQIDEWIVARIWHGQPVSTEPENIDVFVPGENKFIILPENHDLIVLVILQSYNCSNCWYKM